MMGTRAWGRAAIAAALVAGLFAVAGCSGGGSKTSGSTGGSSGAPAEKPAAKEDPYASIPIDGPGEKAAVAAIPSALETSKQWAAQQGKEHVDVSAAKPVLYAYRLDAYVGETLYLLEVRENGKAYGLYTYPAEPDAKKLFAGSAASNEGAPTAPSRSEREKAAAEAARALVSGVAGGKPIEVKVGGYFFVFLGKDGKPIKTKNEQDFVIMVDPAGGLGQSTI